jgi:trk system potassium uptake protein
MYIIIAGCRKVGSNLALELSQENHNVVVIDSDPGNLEALGSGFNGITIAGMPIDEDVLQSAGIHQADALAAVTNDDNINIMVAQIAKEIFHVPIVITRIYDPERDAIMSELGLTTLCATTLAVRKLKSLLLPGMPEILTVGGHELTLRTVKPTVRQTGKTIEDGRNIHVLGIIRNGQFKFMSKSILIEPSDQLITVEYTAEGE